LEFQQGIGCWTREKRARIFAQKNTGDLQGENLRKYNTSDCNRDEKSNRHETVKNREKNRKEQREKQGRTALLWATKNPPMSSGGRQIAQIGD
jgi:hypothetical protein